MRQYDLQRFAAVVGLMRALEKQDPLAVRKTREMLSEARALKRQADAGLGLVRELERDLEFAKVITPLFGLKPGQELEALERWGGYKLGPMAESDGRWLLSVEVSEALKSARLVLWWSGKQFTPAFYCEDIKTAMYVYVLVQSVRGKGWGLCPHCGDFFVQRRADQIYCLIAHREAHRVARWRAAQVKKSGKKGGKHGTRKTR